MEEATKRFIKKVPPSGAAPVFKLTLPHQIVHSHLSHLIDTEFEIATSATATNCWQGNIAPRRNKNRSEYTLQGWRLFAEAHGVQPGDQVSFELVGPKRLVVKVISTEDTKLSGTEQGGSPHEGSGSPPDTPLKSMKPELGHTVRWPREQQGEKDIPHYPTRLHADGARPAKSLESSFQSGERAALPKLENLSQFFTSGPAAVLPPAHAAGLANLGQSSVQLDVKPLLTETNSLPTWSKPADTLNPATPRRGTSPFVRTLPSHLTPFLPPGPAGPTPPQGSGPPDQSVRAPREANSGQSGLSPSQLQAQIMDLKSTVQAQQADLHFFETRARRAEYEASQLKLFYSEMQVHMSNQTRLVVHAGEALEKLINDMSRPDLLMSADQATADKIVTLQTDLFTQVQKLKSSLLHLMSLEI